LKEKVIRAWALLEALMNRVDYDYSDFFETLATNEDTVDFVISTLEKEFVDLADDEEELNSWREYAKYLEKHTEELRFLPLKYQEKGGENRAD